MLEYPEEPEDRGNLFDEEASPCRYGDTCQDGRLRLEGVWPPVGRLLWKRPPLSRVLHRLRVGHGITNVLVRMVLEATEHRVFPQAPLRHELRCRFEQSAGVEQAKGRVLFTSFLRTEVSEGTGSLLARAYGQRVLTRLTPTGEHQKITELPDIGLTTEPLAVVPFTPAEQILALPKGAVPLDAEPRLEQAAVIFGLSHTDVNQHVNFLVYPRFFEQAALARFVTLGLSSKLLCRRVDIVYRKPSFAGDVARVAVRAFRLGEHVGAVVALVEGTAAPARVSDFSSFGKPRCVANLLFST